MPAGTLDPEIAAILAQIPTRPKGRLPIEQQRAGLAMAIAGMQKGLQPRLPDGKFHSYYALLILKKSTAESEYRIEDHTIPVEGGEFKARVIVPKADEELPILVWYHGGGTSLPRRRSTWPHNSVQGWALGNIDMDDYYLRIISATLKIVTVNVEYRYNFNSIVLDAIRNLTSVSGLLQNSSSLLVSLMHMPA